MPVGSVFEDKAAVTFAACCGTDFDVIDIDVVIMLVLLMIIGSVIHVVCIHVVFLMLFVLQEAFAILVEQLLVVVRTLVVFFLLAIVRSRLVAQLCIQFDVRLSGWLNKVLRYSQFAIHVWVRWLLLLLALVL